jgi:S-adenosylmethionine hydrolase
MKLENRNRGIVTLITDFGTKGEYSGAMKGAILRVNPRCQIIDITHEIEPQNIRQAAWVLEASYPYYPPGTIHVVVVDPGVGMARRAVVLHKEGYTFVGPDNGVFSRVLDKGGRISAYEITKRKIFLSPLSDTFHGRDIFAPAAGHLSIGLEPRFLGPRARDLTTIEWPIPRLSRGRLRGVILWADSFGNLITNVSRKEHGPELERRRLLIKGKGWRIERICRTYGESLPGQPLALFGSGGSLELSVNRGNALNTLGLNPGDPIIIKLL